MEPAEEVQDRARAHAHSDDLPPWLAPGVNPVPPGPLSKPAVAWGGTLTATALMVAFGMWLGDVPAPPPTAAAGSVPAAMADRPAAEALAERTVPSVPPLVLAEPAPAAAAAPAVVASPPVLQQRPVSVIKRPAVLRHRTVLASVRPAPKARPRVMSTSYQRNRIAAIDSGETQRIRCKHGELARECLARYR